MPTDADGLRATFAEAHRRYTGAINARFRWTGSMRKGKKDTRTYSLDELRALRERGETETRADAPPLSLSAEFWENVRVVMPPGGKSSVHLRVDSDVLQWFKEQGRGHLTRMNAVLRSYMEAHKQHRPR